jgi:hypothetical protein
VNWFDLQAKEVKKHGSPPVVDHMTQADFKFFHKIARETPAEPAFFRSLALSMLGVMYFGAWDPQGGALECFDEAFA